MIDRSENITLITMRNIPNQMELIAEVFRCVSDKGINVDMITQTQAYKNKVDLSFTVEDDDLPAVIEALSVFKKDGIVIDILSNCSKIVYIDEKMCVTPGYGAKIFTLLANKGIEALIITTSVTDISVLLEGDDLEPAIEALTE